MNNKNYIFFAILALTGSAFAQNNIPQLVSADKYQPLVNAQNQVSNGVQQPITTQKPLTLFGTPPTQKPVAVFGPTPMPKPVPVYGGTTPTCNGVQLPTPIMVDSNYGGIQNTKPVAVFGGTAPQKPRIPPISTVYPKPVFGGTTPTSNGVQQPTPMPKPVPVYAGIQNTKPVAVFGGTAPTSNGEIQNTKPVYGGIQNTKPVAVFGGTTK